ATRSEVKNPREAEKASHPPKAEVMARIFYEDDDEGSTSYTENGMTFEQLFEESQQESHLNEGQVIVGKVVGVTAEKILVDVGQKSEGEVSAEQFKNAAGEITVAVGDEVHVMIERMENSR